MKPAETKAKPLAPKKTQVSKVVDENTLKVQEIKQRLSKGEKTTFMERNIANIFDKRARTKKRKEEVKAGTAKPISARYAKRYKKK